MGRLLGPISKLTTCQDDDQQRQHTRAEREGKICAAHDGSKEKWLQDAKGVVAAVQQDGDEDAASPTLSPGSAYDRSLNRGLQQIVSDGIPPALTEREEHLPPLRIAL